MKNEKKKMTTRSPCVLKGKGSCSGDCAQCSLYTSVRCCILYGASLQTGCECFSHFLFDLNAAFCSRPLQPRPCPLRPSAKASNLPARKIKPKITEQFVFNC